MKIRTTRWAIRMTVMAIALTAVTFPIAAAEPLGTSFSYQGQLKQGGVPVAETCDFEFTLWNNAIGTLPSYKVGPTLTFDGVGGNPPPITVTAGLFAADLDFGADAFGGYPAVLDQRWLEIQVACPSGDALQPLNPRQPIRAMPYALQTRGLYVDENRNVGMGTTTPTNRLSVMGNANIMGNVGIGDQTPTSKLSVGNGGKFLVSGFDGDLTFTDDNATIKFPPTDGTNSPMIEMFTSGFNNGDRMVIQHSQSWRHGLQFEDSTNRFHFINTGGERLMSIDLMQSKVGIGKEAPSAKLHIGGTPGVDGIMFPDGTLQTTAGGGGGLWTQSSSDIYYNSGNVGIGEVNPTALLHLGGTPGADGIMFPDGTLQTTAAVVGGGGDSWALSGNAGTTPGAHFVGTTDDEPLELHVGGVRALRIEPNGMSPNLIGGYRENMVNLDVVGATISGGGAGDMTNRVTDEGGAIAGGMNNQAGDDGGTTIDARDATVAGGYSNTASGLRSTVGGGRNNTASGTNSAVGGGFNNNASDNNSVVSGGGNNNASGNHATVAGGARNNASGGLSAVGGGDHNTALGYLATVPGGSYNEASGTYSFAAGQRAHAIHTGSFVWSDSTTTDPDLFRSTDVDQFLINATGGVGINTDAPGAALHIGGEAGVDGIMFPDGTLQTTAGGGGGDSLWSESGGDIFYAAGSVGIGTSDPQSRLHVIDPVGFAILGECIGEGTSGYLGHEHAGVYGESSSPTGYGGWFEGRGYFSGDLRVGGNIGVGASSPAHPLHVEGGGLNIIYAKTTATSTLTHAVRGDNISIAGAGVSGEAMANTGTAAGVMGGAQSPNGAGVLGYNDSDVAPAIGVRGVTVSPTGFGGYFEGRGYFSGNVGIGEEAPAAKLHLGGTPGADGIMFPDGTLQTTAAVGGGGDSLWSESGSNIYYTAGRVGIGTSSPQAKLHLAGADANLLMFENGGSPFLALGDDSTTVGWLQWSSPNDRLDLYTYGHNYPIAIGPTSSGGIFVDTGTNSGNVGIGEEAPAAKLHIGGTPGADGIMFPDGTLQLTAAFGSGGDSDWSASANGIHYNDGNVGIGTPNPPTGLRLWVLGDTQTGIKSETTADGGWAVWGVATAASSNTIGVNGTAADSSDGIGVYGWGGNTGVKGITTSSSGWTYGVFGECNSPGGRGVYGKHSADSGSGAGVEGVTNSEDDWATGVYGYASSTATSSLIDRTIGVSGFSQGGDGIGVYGAAMHATTNHSTYGGYFEMESDYGAAVRGKAHDNSASAINYGGFFESNGGRGRGVYAKAQGANAFAGYFSGRGYFSGDVGIGTSSPVRKLDVRGWARVDVLEIVGGADLSEQFDVTAQAVKVEPGMVVAIDAENPGKLTVATSPYDRKVAGVVSGAGGVQPGMLMGQRNTVADGEHPVALTGRVWTLCDSSNGAIQPGDLLTSSNTAGHAMKVTDHGKAQGAIIGKAMTALDSGTGLVLILVSLQ